VVALFAAVVVLLHCRYDQAFVPEFNAVRGGAVAHPCGGGGV
jgi:hypothetical protein